MPTFPSPPLKFRTAGFPQYGFKVSLSAEPARATTGLSLLPAYPGRRFGLHPPSRTPRLRDPRTPVASPEGQSGGILTAGCAADPRGPWLRSEFCCLGPSSAYYDPIRQSRRHRGDFTGSRLIRAAFAVRERRGDPRDLPDFPWRAVRTCRRPYPGGSAGPSRCPGPAIPGSLELRASRHPRPRLCQQSPTGVPFEAASFASCCGPCVCPALLAGYDG